ncbi:MAG: hypothetical protein H6733_14580 [Alphaproteobacteria bacterium]|nr:hypothetical protein [Alphaproteobacteria bacterium]
MTSSPTTTHPRHTAATLSALLVGAVAGGLGVWFATEPEPEPEPPDLVEVVRDYTDHELEVVCLPYMRKTATTLEEAQTRVAALESRIREKEDEIETLEDELSNPPVKDGAETLNTRLATAREQLSDLEQQLARAQEDKVKLLVDLKQTREALAGTRIELAASEARVVEAKQEALDQRWTSFVQNAQLRICEGGNAAGVRLCRELVDARMSPHEKRYKDCVRSGQAIPEVRKARRGEEIARDFTTWIDPDDRTLRDWYIYFCDPDLPEAGQQGRDDSPFEPTPFD